MKLKLNEDQLFRVNSVYFPLGVAELEVQTKQKAYNSTLADIKREVGAEFTSWNPLTGETDYSEPAPEAVEVAGMMPPRRRKKATRS